MHIDVRRTSGGLHLAIHDAIGCHWRVRLAYDNVDKLITAIRTGNACSVAAIPDSSLTYLPSNSEVSYPVLVTKIGVIHERGMSDHHITLTPAIAMAISNALRAHMPDRMRPL